MDPGKRPSASHGPLASKKGCMKEGYFTGRAGFWQLNFSLAVYLSLVFRISNNWGVGID